MKPALVFLLLALGACKARHPATAADCAALVDQIIAIGLRQSDFRDPVLEQSRARELRPLLAPELAACRRLAFTDSTLNCARHATSPRALAHACLR